MVVSMQKSMRTVIAVTLSFLLLMSGLVGAIISHGEEKETEKSYIKWVDFRVCLAALEDTMALDIETYNKLYHISWIDSLSYLACKNGNNWSSYRKSQLTAMVEKLGDIYTVDDLMSDNEYYSYYKKAFNAVLGGMLSEYEREVPDGNGGKTVKCGYGLVAYSPVAEGFYYNHYDDFGNSRSYGYKRQHLGNDLMGNIGTPIIAVEGGTVESFGWNQYGGWRIGIRSDDTLRYYYYAHLQKDRPFAEGLKAGDTVQAGDLIGFMGRTGYSDKENTNNIETVHLHFGIQLVFNESQKECLSEIWIDPYNIVRLLHNHRSSLKKGDNGWERVYPFVDLDIENYPPQ